MPKHTPEWIWSHHSQERTVTTRHPLKSIHVPQICETLYTYNSGDKFSQVCQYTCIATWSSTFSIHVPRTSEVLYTHHGQIRRRIWTLFCIYITREYFVVVVYLSLVMHLTRYSTFILVFHSHRTKQALLSFIEILQCGNFPFQTFVSQLLFIFLKGNICLLLIFGRIMQVLYVVAYTL